MKRLNVPRIGIVVLGVVLAVLACAGSARADFAFGTPVLFDEPVNSTGVEYFDCISADGLEVYVERPVSGGITASDWDIYVSTRATTNDPWSVPGNLGPGVNSSAGDGAASLSGDGLELYFSSNRSGSQDIWVAKRGRKGADWGPAANLGPTINTSGRDWLPWITADALELYFSSERSGGYGGNDIWVAKRTTTNDPWGEPMNLGPVINSTGGEFYPCLSVDGLALFFSDFDHTIFGFRPGGHGWSDMWMSRRKSMADPWEPPVNLGSGMNTNAWDSVPRVSPDGSILYFSSSRPESQMMTQKEDIWQAAIIPLVDFNADGMIDLVDLVMLIESWGTDNTLYDIGPMPWGDGIVDEADLEVLMSYWGQEPYDPALIAHWKLDEAEGTVAADSIGTYDGVLVGGPLWQPTGGKIGGALQLLGSPGLVMTPFVCNPAAGPFSVFAWVQGGGPDQVIIAQANGACWLKGADLEEMLQTTDLQGALMTELKGARDGPLFSTTVITNGAWHRVGLVWNGSNRILYVDGIEVARDKLGTVTSSTGGLAIGGPVNPAQGSPWAGLIDDVRIYNRAVNP